MNTESYDLNTSPECSGVNNGIDNTIENVKDAEGDEKVYTYDEAIDLTGSGWYIYTLLLVLSLAIMGMTLDMFGISVVVISACDLELTHAQESILLSMPFVGSILMAYPWGYIADTQGRLKGLGIALWGSFILASLSAFSPNWIVLAVLRFGSSSLSSGVLSLCTTLLGESSSSKVKGPALLLVNTTLFFTFGVYNSCAYIILNLKFTFDLGFIVFTNWRLLTLVLALPLGASAVFSLFYFESPKFLLNAGDDKNSLIILRKISERNGVDIDKYPVQRVALNEKTSLRNKDTPFLQTLLDQIFPLFKPPLLYKNMLLFFITAVIYSHNNGFTVWMPPILDSFSSDSDANTTNDLCGMITGQSNQRSIGTCIETVNELTVWLSVAHAVTFSLLNIVVSFFSHWKKAINIALLTIPFIFGVAIPHVTGKIISILLFFIFLSNCLCMPIIFSYYVDMFPTSYRGMAACLGVMAARLSALIGTNLIGTYLESHCSNSFYSWSVFVVCGAIASYFLPPDKPKK